MNKRLEDSLKKALLEIGRLKSEVKFLRAENAQLQMQQVSFSTLISRI
jgi:regulator of replication initiation timing